MVVATGAAVFVIMCAAWGLTNPASPADPPTHEPRAAPTSAAATDVTGPAVRPDPAWTPPRIVPVRPSFRPQPGPPDTPPPLPLPSPAPESTPRSSSVLATYATLEVWDGGFQTSISLTNATSEPQLAKLVLVFPPGVKLPDRPACWWDVTCEQDGWTVTVTTTSPLEPGTQRIVGFNAVRGPGSSPYEPQQCTINGNPCDGF